MVFQESLASLIMYLILFTIMSVVYLKALNKVLKSKYAIIPLILLAVLVFLNFHAIYFDLTNRLDATEATLVYIVMLKLATVVHGIFYLTVLLANFKGLKDTVKEFNAAQRNFIVTTIALTSISASLHSYSWNYYRYFIALNIVLFLAFILNSVVAYSFDYKLYVLYITIMFIPLIMLLRASNNIINEFKYEAYKQSIEIMIVTLIASITYGLVIYKYEVRTRIEVANIEK